MLFLLSFSSYATNTHCCRCFAWKYPRYFLAKSSVEPQFFSLAEKQRFGFGSNQVTVHLIGEPYSACRLLGYYRTLKHFVFKFTNCKTVCKPSGLCKLFLQNLNKHVSVSFRTLENKPSFFFLAKLVFLGAAKRIKYF